jgi:hypothetical protein
MGPSEPVFHGIETTASEAMPVRLVRVGPRTAADARPGTRDTGIVALAGPNVWVWDGANFQVIDMREW